MTKKLLFFIFILGLSACSSSQKTGEDEQALSLDDPSPVQNTVEKQPPKAAESKAVMSDREAKSELETAIKSQNEERMKDAAEEQLKRVTDHPLALNTLAMYYFRKGKTEYAGYLISKALQKDPQQSALHSNLGLVQMARGESELAIKSFRRAIELNSRDGIAAANAGAIYVKNKDYIKAALVLEIAYDQGIRDAKTVNNYGVALAATGNPKKAKDMYSKALKENSSGKELLLNYAILLIEHLNSNDEGLETLNRLKFIGVPTESRERVSLLENKAKAGLK